MYPELVIRVEAKRVQGVRYENPAPMLLNEAQQQRLADCGSGRGNAVNQQRCGNGSIESSEAAIEGKIRRTALKTTGSEGARSVVGALGRRRSVLRSLTGS